MSRAVVSRVATIAIAGLALLAGTANASPNGGPGTAPLAQLGAPLTGVWAGTPSSHPVSRRGVLFPTQWWRVAPFVRTGDVLQIAVDNTRNPSDLAVCLLSPTDEFGADSALGACERQERIIPRGRLDRILLRHAGSSGQPLLVFHGGLANQGGGYTAVVERVTKIVKIAADPPQRIRRKFTFRASVRFGDGTRAPDGTVGILQWTRSGRNPGPTSFTRLDGARSVRGRLKFKARLPDSARNRVRLRACVIQPDGGVACTKAARVRIR